MSFKKTILAVAAVGALTAATAVPAMALENEFHGLYRLFAFESNAETGGSTFNLQKNARDTFFVEQRARLMYIAKANDDLKLVTHFELDARFGGQDTSKTSANASNAAGASNKYPIGDGGGLDADRVSLEMKNVYLDFNIPATPVNMKVGIQPFNDAFQGVFGNFDGAGAVASAKIGPFTPTLGWFRIGDNNFVAKNVLASSEILPGKQSQDLIVVDGKFAITKDIVVGGSYYNVQNDRGSAAVISDPTTNYNLLHMLGANASVKVGPAALSGFLAYQFGDFSDTRKLSAFAGSAIAKVEAGPGKINGSVLYLSGNKDTNTTGDFKAFRQLDTTGTVSYFNPSNMWLLVRNGQTINSSTAIGSTDLTKGNNGFIGFFGGYEVALNKLFVSGNVGYGMVDKKGTADSSSIGTELNATIGYKLYDNLTASFTAAYLILGDGANKKTGTVLHSNSIATPVVVGVADASNPYMTNIQLNYVF